MRTTRFTLVSLLFIAAAHCASVAAATDWAKVITPHWVGPVQDRLALVMPWDNNRPGPGAVCPPGESRQIWLDIDGHQLTAGSHRFWVIVKAAPYKPKTPKRKNTDVTDDLLDELEDETTDNEFTNPRAEGRAERTRFLRALATGDKDRNYWYHWVDNLKYKKMPLQREQTFVAAVEQAVASKTPLPRFVVWNPGKWIDLPPKVLPPTLKHGTQLPKLELCLDEYESACLTVTNTTPAPLSFTLRFAAAAPAVAQRLDTYAAEVQLEAWPIRLPAKSRFEVYSWNYGNGDLQHLAFLQRMKVNWFSLSNPKFSVNDGKLVCDFTDLDKQLPVVRKFGKGMFIFAALPEFMKELDKQTGVKRGTPECEHHMQEYFGQWLRHMREQGWEPEDYAVELWDEPGQKGHHDQQWKFDLIAAAAKIMQTTEPDVQIMENPLMFFHRKWYDQLAPHVKIWCPYGGLIYLKDSTHAKTWDDVKDLDPTVFAESNLMTQVYLRDLAHRYDSRRWTYFQRDAKVQNGIVYFRHFPWKNKWMGFDGVSFWSSWYATGGALDKPIYLGTRNWQAYAIKGMYGWRDGVEDVQYLELLEDRVAATAQSDPAASANFADVLKRAQKRVADTGWWARTPELLENAIHESRREIAKALIRAGNHDQQKTR